jgi:hypothetical protein
LSPAEGWQRRLGGGRDWRVVGLVTRRHEGVDLVLSGAIVRLGDLGDTFGPARKGRRHKPAQSGRKLPSKATSSVVPSKSPVKKACFVPTRSEILDSMPGSLTNLWTSIGRF